MKKRLSLENFIYLIIFLLPSYLAKLSVFGLSTNVLEILIAIALIWTLLLKLGFRSFLKPSFRIAVGLILAGLIISTLVNRNYFVGFGILKSWFVLPIILAMITRTVIPKEKLANVYQAIYFSGFGVAVISLQNYFAGITTFDGRLQGIFNSPNYLAMYLAPAIIIGLIKKEKGVHRYPLGLILLAFYLTYSYAAWIAVGLVLLILILVKNSKTINFKKSLLIVGLATMLILSQWNNQKFQDLKNISERSSLESRLMIWHSAEKIIADNWFFGIGPGNFQNKYLEYQKHFPPYLEWAVPHPHNLFLAFWLSGGLLALSGFISLLMMWFKEISKQEKNALWLASVGIMAYFLLHGLVDTTYFKNDLAVIFWLNFLLVL